MRSLAIDSSLEGIAGPPLAMLTDVGSMPISSPLGPLEGRTVYAIMDIINTSGNWSTFCWFGSTVNSGQLSFQTASINSNSIVARVNMVNGSNNLSAANSNSARVPGKRVIAWVSVSNGMNKALGGVNDTVGRTQDCIPGDGMETNPILNLVQRADIYGVFAAAYRGEHNVSTRARILNWLTQRYNITP